MTMQRCTPCGGSGRVMGGGMIIKDCEECDGRGKIKKIDDEIDYLTMKQTKSYKSAKTRLQKKHPNLSEDEAEKMLDKAFEKEKVK
jgi:hypothetical protein